MQFTSTVFTDQIEAIAAENDISLCSELLKLPTT